MIRHLLRALAEVARLRLPVTASAALATVLAIAEPLGLDLGGPQTARVTGALVALGVIAEWVRLAIADQPASTSPAGMIPPEVAERPPGNPDQQPGNQ